MRQIIALIGVLLLLNGIFAHKGPSRNPFDTNKPPFEEVEHKLPPTDFWGNVNGPYPTNAFWTNFVLENGDLPATPLPFVVSSNPDKGIVIGTPIVRAEEVVVFGFPTEDIFFSAAGGLSRHKIVSFDLASFTAQWRVHDQLADPDDGFDEEEEEFLRIFRMNKLDSDEGNTFTDDSSKELPDSSFNLIMVYGSPYLTFKVKNVAPVITFPVGILSVNGESQPTKIKSSRFVFEIQNGNRYILYSLNGEIEFNFESNVITASEKFSGVLRLGTAPGNGFDDFLDNHVEPYAVGCDIDTCIEGDTGFIYFKWITEGNNQSELAMYSLPHHRDSLGSWLSYVDSPTIRTLKGEMKPILGNVWTLEENLTKTEWHSRTKIADEYLEAVKEAVKEDCANTDSVIIPEDTYSFGKVASRFARLALIADEVGDEDSKEKFLNKLQEILDPWVEQLNDNKFLYDKTWGGVISVTGHNDSKYEYGQGWYNDQHFHYGYFLYAASVLAHFKHEWVSPHKDSVTTLARAIANPSSSDEYFIPTRFKDWFNGHSWASGLFPFGDAKNQESTSESINGYYGVYLWGLAIGDKNIKDFGRLLLQTEIRSSMKYWHMTPGDDSIYPSPFNENYCVGILWCTKVDFATWFGQNLEYIFGIQMLPFTPITEEYLPREWVESGYGKLSTCFDREDPKIVDEWAGYVYMAQGIFDKRAAWDNIMKLKNFDNGNSKSNALWFIATRN